MDLPNLWLWSGLRIGPQLMDGLSAGRSLPRTKEEEEKDTLHVINESLLTALMLTSRLTTQQQPTSQTNCIRAG